MSMMYDLREKIIDVLKNDPALKYDPVLKSGIKKFYKGMPKEVTVYPAILVDWDRKVPKQRWKGPKGRQYDCYLSIVVLNKYFKYEERQDKLLNWTDKIETSLITNRYLDGLKDASDNWRVIGLDVEEVLYEALIKPRDFVLDSSEIKAIIKVEGK